MLIKVCTAVQAVVMWKGEFRPPTSPKLLNLFWWNLTFQTIQKTIPCICFWCDNGSGLVNSQFARVRFFFFSSVLVFLSCTQVAPVDWWTDFDDLQQGCAIWGFHLYASIFKGQISLKAQNVRLGVIVWIGIFKQNGQKCKIAIVTKQRVGMLNIHENDD